jgi:hypothetical protein
VIAIVVVNISVLSGSARVLRESVVDYLWFEGSRVEGLLDDNGVSVIYLTIHTDYHLNVLNLREDDGAVALWVDVTPMFWGWDDQMVASSRAEIDQAVNWFVNKCQTYDREYPGRYRGPHYQGIFYDGENLCWYFDINETRYLLGIFVELS